MTKIQVRVDRDALDRWKAAVGVPMEDAPAVRSALELAATMREREAGCIAHGARWLLELLRSGYVVVDGCEVSVEGKQVTIGHPQGRQARLGWGGPAVRVADD